jgi:ketosteroid isomerase-like protein
VRSVEVASRLYEAFSSGDVDGLLALLDPEVEWELLGPEEIPYFGAYRGIEEARRFLGLLRDHCQVEEFEVRSLIETEQGALARVASGATSPAIRVSTRCAGATCSRSMAAGSRASPIISTRRR